MEAEAQAPAQSEAQAQSHGDGVGDSGCKETVIMIAVDESPQSIKALRWALENLTECSSGTGKVILVHSQSTVPVAAGAHGNVGFYMTPSLVETMKKRQEYITNSILDEAKRICGEYQVHQPRCIVTLGDPRDGICEAVEKEHVDVLVIGSHGYGAIKRAFLGSVSDYCAHHANCAVIIVKGSRLNKSPPRSP